MKLVNCPRCERHVAADSGSCPFCDVKLGTTPGVARVAMVAAVGLTMASCVTGDNGGSDYAGPAPTTVSTSAESGDMDTSGSGETGGTGGSSGEESTGGGESTSAGGTDSGGQDYAGAAPRDPGVQARGGGS